MLKRIVDFLSGATAERKRAARLLAANGEALTAQIEWARRYHEERRRAGIGAPGKTVLGRRLVS